MVGRQVSLALEKEPQKEGERVLEVRGLTVVDPDGVTLLDGVDIDVHEGEVLGIAGVQGNGQTELAEALLGLMPNSRGRIVLQGKDLTGAKPSQVLDAGVGFVPEDRTEDALVADFSVAENLVLDQFSKPPYGGKLALHPAAIRARATKDVETYDVRTSSIENAVSTLSGGNQQKLVMARALGRDLSLLVVCQPTRGVDVGSIEFLHRRILDERDKGTPVVVVSTELDEITQLSDRIAVMYRGRILGIVPGNENRDVLGLMMGGLDAEAAREAVAEGARTTDSELAEEGDLV
jgi:simple sugar transport system ATP-binding protein